MAPDAPSQEDPTEKGASDNKGAGGTGQKCRKLVIPDNLFLYKLVMTLVFMVGVSMVVSLFVLQAYMSWRSHLIMSRSQLQKEVPQGMFDLYFDYLEWGLDAEKKVDLRANTTIFVY